MFINTKKFVSTVVLSSLVLSGVMLTPGLGLAKNKGDDDGYKNHGQKVSAEARAKNDKNSFRLFGGFNLGIGGLGKLLPGINSTTSASFGTFKQQLKDAKKEQKDAKKEAKAELRIDLQNATTDQQKKDAFKEYLQKVLAAFQAFATAKTNAFQAFIDAFGSTTVNVAPTANGQTVQVTKNTAKAITLTGSDPEGSALTYFVLNSTSHGVLSGSAPNLSYLPAVDFTGTDQFTFWVSDGSLSSTTATVNINVVNP